MESDLTIRKIERADADRLLHEFRRQGWAKPREVRKGIMKNSGGESGRFSSPTAKERLRVISPSGRPPPPVPLPVGASPN